jgi:hypothetical protein
MSTTDKPNADNEVLFPPDHLGNPPIAWIVEPALPPGTTVKPSAPYLTLKADVAIKRCKAGDHVTPYHTQHEIPQEDEL